MTAVIYLVQPALHGLGLTQSWNQAYVDFTKSKDVVADVKASSPDELDAHAVILLTVAEKPFQQAAEYVHSRVLLSPLARLHMPS